MPESSSHRKTTRRDALKLAGAAALGAAGTAAMGAPRVFAAGSGNTIGMYFAAERSIDTRGSAKIGHGGETVVGPYFYPGSTSFTWEDYSGIIGNLTAVSWTGTGWLSVRPSDGALTGVSNINFWGTGPAWANFFICRFGTTSVALGKVSDGKFIVHSGAAPTNFIVDIFGLLGPDQ
ncbi:MAG TPA: hypothetical protein VIP57_01600 [Candidatus Dormibacteraeota bacterium]|jgi:hypothetical protein